MHAALERTRARRSRATAPRVSGATHSRKKLWRLERHQAVGRSPWGNDRASAKWFSKVQSLTPWSQRDRNACPLTRQARCALLWHEAPCWTSAQS